MRRRVLWVIKGLGPGGAERLLCAHANRHNSERFEIECAYVLPWKDHVAEELEQAGIATRCMSTRRRDLLWPFRLAALVRSGQWDVVHVHSPLPGSIARLSARLMPSRGRPTIVATEHNVWTSHRRPTRLLNRLTSRWNGTTFAVTDEVCASMSGPAASRTATLRHGIDVDTVAELRTERSAARAELGIAPATFLIGTVANFREQKDYPNLLHAVRLLVDRAVPVHLVAVGQGPQAAAVADLVEQLDLGRVVTLTGFRSDAPRVMAAADVFTLASRWEGLPVAVMEATALGLPIVATQVGGLAEHFHHGVDAVLVPPGNSAALADALHAVASDADRRHALGTASAFGANRFDAAAAIDRIESAYQPHNIVQSSDPIDRVRPGPTQLHSVARRQPGIEIRPATPDDRSAVIELCRTALGWGDDPRFEQLFAWKHDHNAFGSSYQWVAVERRKVIGLRAFMRWEFVRDGEVLRAVRAVDTAVHPDHQGRGLFTAMTLHGLEEVEADGIDFVFNTPNAKSRPGYLKMGWKDVGRLPVYIRPRGVIGATRAARSRVGASHWPQDDGALGLPAADGIPCPTAALPPDRAVTTRMDNDVLNWRYRLPILGYRVLTAGSGIVIVRLRSRGTSLELVVLHHAGASATEIDHAIGDALDASGASHAISLQPILSHHKWFRIPRLGPTLTWRSVTLAAQPHLDNWNLQMGDIELI